MVFLEVFKKLQHHLFGFPYMEAEANFFKRCKLSPKLIENVIRGLEDWRMNFNGECAGYGIDPYFRQFMKHYPMAYAFYVRGFIEMYKYTKENKWLKKAIKALELLDRISVNRHQYCWGLPFAWKGKENEPYAITTAFVGHAYLDAYEQTSDNKYQEIVKSVINWATNELGFYSEGNKACFWYSPTLKEKVLNSSAELLALIARYSQLTKEDKNEFLLNLLSKGGNYLIKMQQPSHVWPYSDDSEEIDFHGNYIIESMYYLKRCIPRILSFKESEMIVKPYESLLQLLMNRNGSLRMSKKSPEEARLWAYGTYVFTGVSVLECAERKHIDSIAFSLYKILDYMLGSLSSGSGPFYYRFEDHEIRYIRHQSHVFYALAKLLNNNDFWKVFS